MQTIILIVSFFLTGLLATWAVLKGERDKKARKLCKQLVIDLEKSSLDEIVDIRNEELSKKKVDKIKVLALKYLIEERQGHEMEVDLSRYSISNKYLNSFLKKLDPLFSLIEIPVVILSKVILAALMALVVSAFVGGVIYLLSLVISIMNFNWIFIGIVFVLFFLGSLTSVFKD